MAHDPTPLSPINSVNSTKRKITHIRIQEIQTVQEVIKLKGKHILSFQTLSPEERQFWYFVCKIICRKKKFCINQSTCNGSLCSLSVYIIFIFTLHERHNTETLPYTLLSFPLSVPQSSSHIGTHSPASFFFNSCVVFHCLDRFQLTQPPIDRKYCSQGCTVQPGLYLMEKLESIYVGKIPSSEILKSMACPSKRHH